MNRAFSSHGGETKKALTNLKETVEGYLEVKAERLKEQAKGERAEVIAEAPPT